MSRRNRLIAAFLLGAFVFATRVLADETSGDASPAPVPATNHTAFNASVRGGETIGDHQVHRAFLTIGTNQIAFTVPTGFFMDASNQKIVLTDSSSDYFITVRVLGSPTAEAGAAQLDYYRGAALNRFPQAKITSQSSEFAANHSGPSFDMQWLTSNGGAQSVRIVFVPCAAGVLEFSILTRSANFKTAKTYLSVLMSSVRSNETGKLVITPEPDYS